MSEKKRPGRQRKQPLVDADGQENKAIYHGVLTGNSAILYNALSQKASGIAAALRVLAKSEHASLFFSDLDAVREVLNNEDTSRPAKRKEGGSRKSKEPSTQKTSEGENEIETRNEATVGAKNTENGHRPIAPLESVAGENGKGDAKDKPEGEEGTGSSIPDGW